MSSIIYTFKKYYIILLENIKSFVNYLFNSKKLLNNTNISENLVINDTNYINDIINIIKIYLSGENSFYTYIKKNNYL